MAGKKTGKRLLTWVLVLVMALSLLPLNALAKLDTGHKIDVRFTVLYVGDEFNIGYNYGSSEKTQFVCQYSTPHSDTAYTNHTIAISDIKAAAGRATVDSGYQIVGWSKESNANPTTWPLNKSGTTACNKGTTIYLVAKNPNPITKYTYTLVYDANGGTGAPSADSWSTTDSATRTHTFAIKDTDPTREGYVFKGWKANDGSDTIYHSDSTKGTTTCAVSQYGNDVVPNGNTWTRTLYAVWGEDAPVDPAKPSEEDIKNLLVENVVKVDCINSSVDHADQTYPLLDGSFSVGDVQGSASSYTCTVTVNAAKYVAEYNKTISGHSLSTTDTTPKSITLAYDGTKWVAQTATPIVFNVVCDETPDDPKVGDNFDFDKNIVDVFCETTSDHDYSYGLMNDYYTVSDRKQLQNGNWQCEITINLDKYFALYNSEHPGHTRDKEHKEATSIMRIYPTWYASSGKWIFVGTGTAKIFVKCDAVTPPEAPTADELEKLEMAVQVKCDVDDAQQHTEAYGLLGEYNEDYIVGEPKKVGNDWLCDINYVPDPYVAEFNKTFPTLKHIQNDEKIDPVTLIWGGENWQIKTQGRVHVTEEYTVTFNAYGGFPTPDEQHVKSGEKAVLPVAPTLKGYTFAFWYLGDDEQNATAYDFDTPVTGDITLTAKWNINKYTVTFNSYGGTPVPPAQEVEYGLTATEPDAPTLKGHTFAFWYLGDDEQNATAYDFDTPVTGDITLTAKWNINKYTVTFNSYGGTPVPPAQEVEYGLTATEPATAPTKTGYTFDGWYLGDEKYDFSDAVEQNITLYANWEKNIYTVTYTDGVDGEEVFADQTYRVPFEDTTPAFKGTKTRAGYVFAGWKPAFSDTVTGNVTYVAQWKDDKNNNGIADDEEEKYTVTYTDGVANEEVFADQVYGDLLSGTATPAFKGNPTRDGYVFDGWKPAFSDTVTGNVTYVAQWTARTDLSYTVHYYLKNTTKQVANDKMVAGQTFNADVTENAIRISGYRVYGDSVKSITIGTGTNEIIFYYTRAYHPSTPSKPTLNTGDHYAYVMGYPDGTVRPNGSITRAEVSAILFRLLSDETRDEYFTTESSFTDVKAGAWYNNSIATLEKAGVIVDTAKGGAFRPNEAITRAELAAMLAQFSDAKPVKGVKFSDVSAEHWAYEAIAIAAKMGWIEGYPDGTFRPDATITRAEMMTLVNRALERVPSDEDHLLSKRVMLTFPDCKSGDWFYIAVQEATNSHTYERAATEKNGDEQWTALRANRDWTLLEK